MQGFSEIFLTCRDLPIFKRTILYPYCLLILLSACLNTAWADNRTGDQHVSIQLKWQHDFQFAGYYAAIEKGFYKKAGLEVTLKEVDFAKDCVKQVMAGESEYGLSDSALLIYHLKGDPVVLVNQFFQHSPLVFIARSGFGIISPYEMVGKTVAYNISNQGDAPLNALLLKTLNDLSKIKVVKRNKNYQQEFIDGKIDVISAYSTSQPYLLKEKGIEVNIINPQNYGIDFYGDNLFTTQTELQKHPDRLRKISQATVKGWKYALNHPDEIIDLIIKKYNPNLSKTYLQFEAGMIRQMMIPELVEIGSVDPNRYRSAAEDYLRLGFVETSQIDGRFFYNVPKNEQKILIPLTVEEKDWLKSHPIIRYGAEPNWAPFDFVDKRGRHSGLSADILNLISQYSGLTFQADIDEWHNLLAKAKQKQIDLLPAIFYTPDRAEFLTFNPPYQFMLDYFFIHEAVAATQLADLDGKTVAVAKGSVYVEALNKYFPKLKILEVDNVKAAIQNVLERKADLLLDTHFVVTYWLKQNAISTIRPFKVMPPGEPRKLQMAVRKDYPVLADIIQKALLAIPEKQRQQVQEKWLGYEHDTEAKPLFLSQEEQNWLNGHPIIHFAGHPKWLPYEGFDKNGDYIGIVAEHLRLLEQKLQVKLTVDPSQTWDETLAMVNRHEVDVLSETTDSPLRSQFFFTQAYLSSPIVLVMRDDEAYVDNIDQIRHRKLAVINNYGDVPAILRTYPHIKFGHVATLEEGLAQVSTGKIDALLCTLAHASYHISEQGINNVRIVGKTEFTTRLGFGIRKDLAPLVPLFNRALNAITQDEKQKINDLWGKERFVAKIDYLLLARTVAVFLIVIVLFIYWNGRLIQEIARRKRSEQEVVVLNQRFALATEIASLGVWELELTAKPTFVFDAKMFEIYGIQKQAGVPYETWLGYVHKDDHDIIGQALEHLRKQDGEVHIEFRIVHPDGRIRNISCAACSVKDKDKVTKITGVNWDITGHKKTEWALKQAKQQAENANRAKTQFLANMSHEIRTPLNAIIGFTELLNDQIKDAKLRSFVQTIQSAGHSLLGLINDILDLSKIEAGKMRIEKKACNPHNLFTELGQIFMMKMQAKNLDFILDIDHKIPENLILDETRLRQVLFNLLGNAVKFTEAGHVRVRARIGNEDEIHSRLDLFIDVEDTGIGISNDQQRLIFQDFEQSQGQDVRKYGGTGLGLAISKRLTEMMGGEISVKSELGRGSTFTVHLMGVDIAAVIVEQVGHQPVEPYTVRFLPATVLVVDDVENNRSLLKENFADTDLTVLFAENGLEAVESARHHHIDLILMDIRMPVMDGYQAAEEIKTDAQTPIIALTASVMRDDYERNKSQYFDGYLRKPVLKSDLFRELQRFLAYEEVLLAEVQVQEHHLTADELQALPEALEGLLPLVQDCEKISKNNNMADIEKFANKVQVIATESKIGKINEFSSQLLNAIESFDIILIKRLLNDYPQLTGYLSRQLANADIRA